MAYTYIKGPLGEPGLVGPFGPAGPQVNDVLLTLQSLKFT